VPGYLYQEVRSSRPVQPSARYRRIHLWAVVRLTPWASAAFATGQSRELSPRKVRDESIAGSISLGGGRLTALPMAPEVRAVAITEQFVEVSRVWDSGLAHLTKSFYFLAREP
jgi:hypothetical protein